MSLNDILDSLFPAGHAVSVANQVITGQAQTAQGVVAVLGTTDAAAIDHAMALALSGFILDTIEQHPDRPLVFLVDTSGQALSRSQELLCLNGSLAHLAQCVDLARKQGHVSLSLVTANAVSGGFLSFGLMADRAYALADAQVRVMDLRAMSRVTKIAHERLVELAANSPILLLAPKIMSAWAASRRSGRGRRPPCWRVLWPRQGRRAWRAINGWMPA